MGSTTVGPAPWPCGKRGILRVVPLGRPPEQRLLHVLDLVVGQVGKERFGRRRIVVNGGVYKPALRFDSSVLDTLRFDHRAPCSRLAGHLSVNDDCYPRMHRIVGRITNTFYRRIPVPEARTSAKRSIFLSS